MWGVIVFLSNKLKKIGPMEFPDLTQPKISMFALGIVISASHLNHIAGLWALFKSVWQFGPKCWAYKYAQMHIHTVVQVHVYNYFAWGKVVAFFYQWSWRGFLSFQNLQYVFYGPPSTACHCWVSSCRALPTTWSSLGLYRCLQQVFIEGLPNFQIQQVPTSISDNQPSNYLVSSNFANVL